MTAHHNNKTITTENRVPMKTRFAWLAALLSVLSHSVWALTDLDYLPTHLKYDPNISKPEAVLGTPVGEWHVRHDQLVTYMHTLAKQSERIRIEEIGRTHENRPLLKLTITSPANHARLQSIQQQHLQSIQSGKLADRRCALDYLDGLQCARR